MHRPVGHFDGAFPSIEAVGWAFSPTTLAKYPF